MTVIMRNSKDKQVVQLIEIRNNHSPPKMTGVCACKCIIQMLLGFFKDKFIDGDFDGDDKSFVVETLSTRLWKQRRGP